MRIWSSACSSGEEPYSIALTLLNLMPDADRHDILILATDLDPNMIAAGKAENLEAGAMLAARALDSGAAGAKLEALIAASNA